MLGHSLTVSITNRLQLYVFVLAAVTLGAIWSLQVRLEWFISQSARLAPVTEAGSSQGSCLNTDPFVFQTPLSTAKSNAT